MPSFQISVCADGKVIFKRRRFAFGGLGLRIGSGLVAGLDCFLHRLNGFEAWFFHAVARRAPITTLARPKSV